MNVYQKPQELLEWMVGHFSRLGDWVMDLCSGLGTGLISSLAHGRHCVAIELDERQSDVLKGRVLALDQSLGDDDISGPGEGQLGTGAFGSGQDTLGNASVGLDSQT